jgi:hypothetical protein
MVAGNVGSKNNFGFNVKFNKKGKSLQGNVTTMIRKTEVDGLHIYKIKANKIQSLAVQPSASGGKATINARASIQDVTDPQNVISVDGNASLQIKLSDWGNPGNQMDSIAITIWEKDRWIVVCKQLDRHHHRGATSRRWQPQRLDQLFFLACNC